jgi:1-aminocyclopropane-1-carboxylate deaminase/D-cysteine desulfhydrase-like pyridoxal-dependent ACC family enzyme
MAQCEAAGIAPTCIWTAAAGPTQSGLVLGSKALGWDVHVSGIAPIAWAGASMAARTAESADLAARVLGLGVTVSEAEIDTDDRFIGPGYARPSEAGLEAMRLVARTEGLLLDPVYTGKAMAALMAAIRERRLTSADTVVFVHTGGLPAVFAYRDAILEMTMENDGDPET